MKKLLFTSALLAVISCSFVFLSFKAPVKAVKLPKTSAFAGKGTLYVKIKNDPNKGSIHVIVQSPFAGQPKLLDVQLASGQTIEKTFTGLNNGPQSWYIVSLSWPGTDFHNIASGGGSMIASGFPVMGGNMVAGWQIAGTGAFGSIPILLP